MAEEKSTVDGLEFSQVANYPAECRARFLEQTGKLPTASWHRRQLFILPEVDKILDDYLLWLAAYGD